MAIAYGSITLVDIGDLGQLSVVPESNQPTTVIYDPNMVIAQQYNPDWGKNSLVLSPVIYYGGQLLSPEANGLSITWFRKLGSSSAASIEASYGEVVDKGVLTVSKNQFNTGSGQLTYICEVVYNDPTTMGTAQLTAKGQITFSLIKNATKAKTASIIGESVYLYNSEGNLVTNKNITLSANLSSLNFVCWGYKNNNNEWVKIEVAEGANSAGLVVEANSNYFVNDIATIKVFTKDPVTGEDSSITDVHVITKIRDGAPGDQVISVILSNENQMIPCDSKGKPLGGAFDGAFTKITIYEGSTDVTDQWIITASANKVTGSWNQETLTYSVTGFAEGANLGEVNFTCTPSEDSGYNSPVYKKFVLTKVQPGADGKTPTIYSLGVSSLVINKNVGGSYFPSTITMKAYSQTGNENKELYKGRFEVYEGDSEQPIYSSADDESEHSYEINNNNVLPLTIKLKGALGSDVILDEQTVVIVQDGQNGAKGDTGESGKDAISFVLGNYSDIIPCTNAGLTAVATTISIPFAAYKGGKRIPCTITYDTSSSLPEGISLKSNQAATEEADGLIEFSVAIYKDLSNKKEGIIRFTLTADGVSNSQSYTWTKNIQAADGDSAVLFQIWAPNGNIISNGENNVLLNTKLTYGSIDDIASSYQWYKWTGNGENGYELISNATKDNYNVLASTVNSYCSYKCAATYNGKTYEAYFSVYDKTDPLQLHITSTLGTQLVNSVGQGMLYVQAYRNGIEIDPIKTTKCGTQLPDSGEYFYLLDPNSKTVELKKKTGSTWGNPSDSEGDTLKYTWTLRDADNVIISTKVGRAIYIDGSVINKKMTFDVEVKKE